MTEGTEEDEELRQLRAEVEGLKMELAELKAKPAPQMDHEKVDELKTLWDSFPCGDVGQGIQPSSRYQTGPLQAIWRAYFEHTMPGGLKSAALLRWAHRTDIELDWTYPNLKCDWQQKLLEVSLVIHPVTYDSIKMELADMQGRNIVTMGYFQYDTKLGFPQYPYRVQEQDVWYHGENVSTNMTDQGLKNTCAPGTEPDEKLKQVAKKMVVSPPIKIATLKSAYLAALSVGDSKTPSKMLSEEKAADYEEVIAPYRKHHLGEGLEGKDHPPATKAKNGVLLPLYPVEAEPISKFRPNRVYRGAQYIGWWFGQTFGSNFEGAVSHTMITDLLPWLQGVQANNPYDSTDYCGIFMQCRGWLLPHQMAEVILFSDEMQRNQLFIIINPGSDTHALSGFVKYSPRQGTLHQHEVLLATQGVDFLISFARGKGAAKASKAVLNAIDLSNARRD